MGLPIGRRAFLSGGLGLASVWMLGLTPDISPRMGLRVLSAAEAAVIEKAARAYFPNGVFSHDFGDIDVVDRVDHYVAEGMDEVRRVAFRGILHALEWGAVMTVGARFSLLDDGSAREVLQAWGDPVILPRRIASDALKAVLGMAYLSHPRVLDAIGWRAACGGGRA